MAIIINWTGYRGHRAPSRPHAVTEPLEVQPFYLALWSPPPNLIKAVIYFDPVISM